MSVELDILLEDPRWEGLALETLSQEAVAAVLDHLGLGDAACGLTVMGCGDARIAELNDAFRDKAKATNVLSWPEEDLSAEEEGGTPHAPEADFTGEISLGDIAISYETCLREAEAAGKSSKDHVTHLIVHGTLHLLGYDHIRDGDATVMEELEVAILGKLGIANPYVLEDRS